MILKEGSYSHQENEVSISISREPVRSDANSQIGYKERWIINGHLIGTDPADLTTKINALVTAYETDGEDVGLYPNDGTTITSHFLDTSQSLYGVQVISGPDFPKGDAAEYTTFRNYVITLEAEFLHSRADQTAPFSCNETITVVGTGGERFACQASCC